MLVQQWLTSLQNQLRMRSARPRRGRHARKQILKTPSTQSLVSRNVIETLEDRTLLTAFIVQNTDDSGAGSLRDAIAQANLNAGADTITFDASLASQTIVLSDEILISDGVTILGLGADQLTLDGNGNSRIFNIDDSFEETEIVVELSGLTLTNGFAIDGGAIVNYEDLTITDSIVSGNHASNSLFQAGGGVYSAAGSLAVTGSYFTENSGYRGGGIATVNTMLTVTQSTFFANTAQEGGGISFESPYQNDIYIASVRSCSFLQNNVTGDGAGILFEHGQASVSNSIFTDNISDRVGGGIANCWTTLFVENSAFHQNYARVYGGGISNGGIFSSEGGGDLTLLSSTLSENSTVNNGGGYYSNYGLTRIFNSTLSGNSTLHTGGGINVGRPIGVDTYSAPNVEGPAELEIFNSTITGNTADHRSGIYTIYQIEVTNSIIAGNPADESKPQNSDKITAHNSIIQDSIEGLLDPVLRDNGGPVKTHALLTGSAAIDAGDNTAVSAAGLDFDQRGDGFDRIVGGTVDIGAYESQVNHTQVDLRIVSSKTSTGLNGEVSS
ncbi:MAG: hypothetical protein KDA70_20300, partial [Planctomycetaceae bacterium]|nr:hypothetical protein [Planctomycetaceae bacterium]